MHRLTTMRPSARYAATAMQPPMLHAHLCTWALRPMPARATATATTTRLTQPRRAAPASAPSSSSSSLVRHFFSINNLSKASSSPLLRGEARDIISRPIRREWSLPQESNLLLDSRVQVLMAVVGLAVSLAAIKLFAQPHDHELVSHAAVIAERDPQLMLLLNRLHKRDKGQEQAPEQQQQQQAQQADRSLYATLKSVWPKDDDLRRRDPLMLRVGQVYDSDITFDMSFSPPPPPPLPDGSLPVWEQVDNRAEIWAHLPNTNLGDGQMHIVGRRIAEATDKINEGKNGEGKFVVAAAAPQAGGGAAAATPATPAAVTGPHAWLRTPLTPKPVEWEVLQLELLFPQAQPFPVAYVLDTQLQAFVRKVGIDCPPAHAPPSQLRATWNTLREIAWFIAPTSFASAGLWLLAAVPVARSMLLSYALPSQSGWSRRLSTVLRDHPVVRDALELRNHTGRSWHPLDRVSVGKVTFAQESSKWGTQVTRDVKGRAQVVQDEKQLFQVYSMRNDTTGRVAKVNIQAKKVAMEALWGRVHFRQWKITQASIQVAGQKSHNLKDLKSPKLTI